MEKTEKALAAYALPATSIVHRTSAGFNSRTLNPPVHLMQYDKTLPVIAVSLRSGEAGELPYTVPAGAQVNVRMDKADGRHVYNPALGLDSARQTVYIGVTAQMTACAGPGTAVVEVVLDGGVAGAAPVALEIAENPVPEAAINSSDEFLSIAEMAAQAAASAAAAAKSALDAQNSKTAAAGSASAAQDSKSAAQAAADNANESKASASQSASAAQNLADAAAGFASDAAASAALAAQHANPITDAEVNDAGNLILTLSSGNEVDAGHVEGPQGIQGLQGPAGQSAYEAAVEGGYTGTLPDFQAEIAGLPGLYNRFNSAGAAKDTAALGGVSAANILNGARIVNWYVSLSGSDTAGDGSENKPWRTINYAISKIQKYHSYIKINIASGNYAEKVDISYKNAVVNLIGPESGTASVRSLNIYNNSNLVFVHRLDIYASTDVVGYCVIITDSPNVTLREVTVRSNYKNFTGINTTHSNVYLNMIKISGCDKAVSAVYGSSCYISSYQINSQSGTGNNTAVDAYNSLIVSSVAPPTTMATTQYSKRSGAIIFSGGTQI